MQMLYGAHDANVRRISELLHMYLLSKNVPEIRRPKRSRKLAVRKPHGVLLRRAQTHFTFGQTL